MTRVAFSVLIAALAASAPALAAEDPPMSTAPATVQAGATAAAGAAKPAPAPISTADQIDQYLKSSPALVLPKDNAGVTSGAEEPRKVHGEVDVSIGTGGYRSAYVRSDFPVGKTGTLSIAVQDTQFKGRAGRYAGYGGYGGYGFGGGPFGYGAPGQRQSLGVSLALGGAGSANSDARCRQDRDLMRSHQIDPSFMGDGYRGRTCPDSRDGWRDDATAPPAAAVDPPQ